jgi:multidrug efflux pump subunit AcrA (membrane-fusion protein)
MPETTYPATVRQIGPEISTDRGVVGVHLDPKSLPDNAFPGLTVDVNIEVARLENALAVPAESVIRDGSTTYVMAVEAGRAVRREVDLRARGETWMAIDGLEAGIPIVRRAAKIEAGAELRPVETTERGGDT